MTEPVCQCTFLHEKMLEIPLNHHPKSHFVQHPTQHSIMPTWPLAENEFDTSWFRSWLPKDGAPLSARLEPIKNHSTLRSPSFSGSLSSSILASFHFQPARSHCLVVFFSLQSLIEVKQFPLWLWLVLHDSIWRTGLTPLMISAVCPTWLDADSKTLSSFSFSVWHFLSLFCCFYFQQTFHPCFLFFIFLSL